MASVAQTWATLAANAGIVYTCGATATVVGLMDAAASSALVNQKTALARQTCLLFASITFATITGKPLRVERDGRAASDGQRAMFPCSPESSGVPSLAFTIEIRLPIRPDAVVQYRPSVASMRSTAIPGVSRP